MKYLMNIKFIDGIKMCVFFLTIGYLLNEKIFINTFFFIGLIIKILHFVVNKDIKNNICILKNYKNLNLKILGYIMLFSIVMLLSALNAVDINTSLKWAEKYFKWMLIPFFMIWIMAYGSINNQMLKKCVNYGLAVGIVIMSFTLIYKCLFLGMKRPCIDYISNNPNPTAGFILLIMPFIILADYNRKTYLKLLLIALGSLGLIITESRGAIIAYLCLLLITIFIKRNNYEFRKLLCKNIKIGILSLIIVMGLGYSFFYMGGYRFVQLFNKPDKLIENRVGGDRIFLWKSSLNMIEDYPVLGVGLRNFNKVYIEKNYINENAKELKLETTHNVFLNFFVETGIIGGLTFCLLIFYQLKYLFMHMKNDNFVFAYFLTVIGMCIHGMVDFVLIKIYWQMYWFLSGVIWLYIYNKIYSHNNNINIERNY